MMMIAIMLAEIRVQRDRWIGVAGNVIGEGVMSGDDGFGMVVYI